MASVTFSRDAYARKVVQDFEESTRSAPRSGKSGKLTDQYIGIIGAGMAGLYAGLMLDSLGVTNYNILEANPDRVGGRAFTWYFDDKTTRWNYVDLGAMRFPHMKEMDRVIGDEPWSVVSYLNNAIKQRGLPVEPIKLIPYYMKDPQENNFRYYNCTRLQDKEIQYPDPWHVGISNGGDVPDKDVEGPYIEKLLDPAFKMFMEAFKRSFKEGWKKLLEYDDCSVRAYLLGRAPLPALSHPTVEYLECMDSGTGIYDNALTETVLDTYEIFDYFKAEWSCVEGGMSRLPEVMAKLLISKNVEKGKKVTKIAFSKVRAVDVFVAGEEDQRSYDHVINTVPPGVLAMMDTTECNFSYGKRTAVRALRVGSSVKIALHFKTRWWQDSEYNIHGGQSTTDLPIRTIVYPSYGIDEKEAPGVLLASYSWGQDATRLGCLAGNNDKALVELAISNIASVHGVDVGYVRSQYTGKFYIQDWNHYEYSNGPFALFGPGQFTELFGPLTAQEMNNCYHTAGEMASAHHAWIVGALNSAWRCVREIILALDDTDKEAELYEKWGCVCEVTDVCEVPGVICVNCQ